ncbi:murein biosynthesis integral membrane protein MurJ, partial [Methylophilaceae bacterium]|nr:murein biosynthesis integral membrane protein MurJ [Methylophilaceae bacterium]
LLFQYPFILKLGWSPQLDFNLKDDGVWKVLKLMGPAIIGVSITQISLLINTIFASFLQQGSVSWLYFADRLMEFPAGVLGVALSTVFLPALSASFSSKNYEEFNKLMNWSTRIGLLVSIPAAIGIAVLSLPLITTLFYYGKFSELDLVMTHKALFAYSFGLIGLIMIKVFAPIFYSQKNIKTPVRIGIMTLFVTQAMNLILIPYFEHVGLALAISIGATFNAAMLFLAIKKMNDFKIESTTFIFLIKVILSASIMGLVLYLINPDFQYWITINFFSRLILLLALVALGALVFLSLLFLQGVKLKNLRNNNI